MEELHRAARVGDREAVARLLDEGVAVDSFQPGRSTITPLFHACANGHMEVMELLLARGANVNSKFPMGNSPLSMAVDFVNLEAIEILIAHGADTEWEDTKYGETALFRAIRYRIPRIVKLLAEKGADVNHFSRDETPLSLAIEQKSLEMVQLLFDYGARFGNNTAWGLNAITFCVGNDNFEMLQLLYDRGADLSGYDGCRFTPLVYATICRPKTTCQFLLDKGVNINCTEPYGRSALHYAVSGGKIEKVTLLVDAGADLNLKDSDGKGPLYLARERGEKEIEELLIERGAEL
ncbi:ankyrin repeat-containing domain protein [Nemania sp. FL0031]|nr:ankyrin repeat-containing domain protein [Nemania sp. FL0031]